MRALCEYIIVLRGLKDHDHDENEMSPNNGGVNRLDDVAHYTFSIDPRGHTSFIVIKLRGLAPKQYAAAITKSFRHLRASACHI